MSLFPSRYKKTCAFEIFVLSTEFYVLRTKDHLHTAFLPLQPAPACANDQPLRIGEQYRAENLKKHSLAMPSSAQGKPPLRAEGYF
jgi:hypothetical protein